MAVDSSRSDRIFPLFNSQAGFIISSEIFSPMKGEIHKDFKLLISEVCLEVMIFMLFYLLQTENHFFFFFPKQIARISSKKINQHPKQVPVISALRFSSTGIGIFAFC